ncbi:MAG: preprotein translocase subunit SecE [Firmicutes bacterium]|nr:preprotein translocase subunit SecE [Bacillota bacterium]
MSEESKKHEKYEGPNAVQSVYRTYKAEFRKIVWPSRETLIKHTVTVIIVSLIFGAYIALTDGIFGAVFSRFVQLVAPFIA